MHQFFLQRKCTRNYTLKNLPSIAFVLSNILLSTQQWPCLPDCQEDMHEIFDLKIRIWPELPRTIATTTDIPKLAKADNRLNPVRAWKADILI
jgi:hypothetical protein